MRTRSQARRRRQPQVRQTSVESSNLEKPDNPPIVTMADNRTMAQLLEAPTEGYEDAIVIPEITANNFEIKHGLLNLVQNKQFFGHDKEDPHAHIRHDAPIINGSTEDVQPPVVQIQSRNPNPEHNIAMRVYGITNATHWRDLGASINLMPYSVWKDLALPELTPTCMTLELADRSITEPIGIAKDVRLMVGKFNFQLSS
ncbi:reverse transcriptase domain-containing protein [Tanacetum coccineum]|uniref:Reverse transcriptase domain-containing protein n=1 Tax=Tanacetum coccineum TaxID=301880 RepID=A0ABQ5A6J2_9ASTR